jgi:hypothetical protein
VAPRDQAAIRKGLLIFNYTYDMFTSFKLNFSRKTGKPMPEATRKIGKSNAIP